MSNFHVSKGLVMQPSNEDNNKKSYSKPELIIIELTADEVMAVGCKLSSSSGGPVGATCTAVPCVNAGS